MIVKLLLILKKLLDCAKYYTAIKLFSALQSLEIETGTL